MAEPEQTSSQRNCPQCGAELPPNVPPELCPKCLLKAGFGTQPVVGPMDTVPFRALPTTSRGLPQPGEQLGHYRIVRTLGQGGMGAVFEADDLDSGRRVALKALSHTLDSPDARERFFREGRLAASINHPNSVYVFGTEEIGGTPVIAMELVSGGTLQDRVSAHGPLPVGEAVDCVLQIIAGLDAAQQIGILHRDIKPSNCFRNADGGVKIGDFGLSISTAVRTEPALTATGAFLGTPAFCSPEQLRGDELNARSDMYSVGATLFYLLTSRTPFEGKTNVQLLATVLEQRAPSPRKFRPNLPQGLAKVILRCLEKQAGERFKNYEELGRALAPYASVAPTPATIGLRFLAGALDLMLFNIVFMSVLLIVGQSPMEFLNFASQASGKALPLILASFAGAILYYTVLEGGWGAAVGKAICRLRVVREDRNPPGFLRAALRAALYVVLPVLPYWIVYGGNPKAYLSSSQATQYLMGLSYYLVLALLFCAARRRNGFAAVQDLITRTRVVSRAALALRPALGVSELPPAAVENQPMFGPYHVLDTVGKSAGAEWLLGYDLRLLRKVWIRVVPSGMPSIPAPLRNVGRIGRLRWLTGKRSADENWDAFEAVSGKPLADLVQDCHPWHQVRFWLYDLATEINAAEKDGTLPPQLALDRVWITGDGRAKLLDFPAPGLAPEPVAAGLRPAVEPGIVPGGENDERSQRIGVQGDCPGGKMPPSTAGETPAATTSPPPFLSEVAAAALSGRVDADARDIGGVAVPLPLHARAFLKNLPQLLNAGAVLVALKPLLTRVAEVSRWRRAAVVAGCLAFPMLACFAMVFGLKMVQQWNRNNPGMMELASLLQLRTPVPFMGRNTNGPTDRQLAIYVASHYRAIITNETTWSGAFTLAMIKGESRRFAEQSVAEHPSPAEAELAEANRAVGPYVSQQKMFSDMTRPRFYVGVLLGGLAIYVVLPALVAALLFRGGLVLLIAGIAFVRRDGVRASRLRVFWRGLVAWGSLGLAILVTWIALCAVHGLKPTLDPRLGTFGWALASTLLIGALTIVSIALPKRGLPDRLAGTWPVPR